MARGSGGVFGKLVLLGVGAVIGAAMTQKKVESDGTTSSQAGNLKENVKKGLERFNEQSGGMVDKVKPGVNKAVETVKSAIESQQKMMDQEKEMLDKGNETLQKEVGGSSDKSTSGSSSSTAGTTGTSNAGLSSSDLAGSGTSGTAGGSAGSVGSKGSGSTSSSSATGTGSTGASSGSSAIDSTPTGGIYGGSTEYTESLKKDLNEKDSNGSKSSSDSTFDK